MPGRSRALAEPCREDHVRLPEAFDPVDANFRGQRPNLPKDVILIHEGTHLEMLGRRLRSGDLGERPPSVDR